MTNPPVRRGVSGHPPPHRHRPAVASPPPCCHSFSFSSPATPPATGSSKSRIRSASLDEPSGVLTGHARISYVNRSPDTLRDFSVHQYLNAFRPGSRWAAADSVEQRERFQHMKDPDYGFERITAARLMGEENRPDYPYAPDST